jgi:hypothetical protein
VWREAEPASTRLRARRLLRTRVVPDQVIDELRHANLLPA